MRNYYQNPLIHKAFGVLERLSADDQMRYLAEAREKVLKDEASIKWEMHQAGLKEGLQKGRLEGIQQGSMESTRKLLLTALEERFGVISPRRLEQLHAIRLPETLERLFRQALRCPNLEAFQTALT